MTSYQNECCYCVTAFFFQFFFFYFSSLRVFTLWGGHVSQKRENAVAYCWFCSRQNIVDQRKQSFFLNPHFFCPSLPPPHTPLLSPPTSGREMTARRVPWLFSFFKYWRKQRRLLRFSFMWAVSRIWLQPFEHALKSKLRTSGWAEGGSGSMHRQRNSSLNLSEQLLMSASSWQTVFCRPSSARLSLLPLFLVFLVCLLRSWLWNNASDLCRDNSIT